MSICLQILRAPALASVEASPTARLDEMTAADYERLAEQTLDEMVAAGEITKQQRDKVFFVRFLAADEVERSGNGPPVPRRRSHQ